MILLLLACIENVLTPVTPAPVLHTPPTEPIPVFVEEFHVPEQVPLNMLFIVDRSCSMKDNQTAVNQNSIVLLNQLKQYQVDYRIAFTTTGSIYYDDTGTILDGRATTYKDLKWVEPTQQNPQLVFNGLYNSLFSPSERGYDAIGGAFETQLDYNIDFFRPEAELILILISDEEDQSWYWNQPNIIDLLKTSALNHAATIRFVAVTHTEPVDYSLWDPREPAPRCPNDMGWWFPPIQTYTSLADNLGGETYDLCSVEWFDLFWSLGEYGRPRTWFYALQFPAVVDSIVVYQHTSEATIIIPSTDWWYDPIRGGVIFYDYIQLHPDVIEIEYEPKHVY